MHNNAYGKKQHHFREKTTLHPGAEASVLIDVFDLSTSNATDGDITVCVDTGADMLCLTSTKNTRVLQWSPLPRHCRARG